MFRIRMMSSDPLQLASLTYFVPISFPYAKRLQRFFAHHLDHWDFPVQVRTLNFPVYERIIKARLCGIRGRAREIDASGARPVNCSQTHRARLAARVKLAIREMKISQLFA